MTVEMAPVDKYDPVAEERAMWEAVLVQTVRDLRSRAERIRSEAREWIESEREAPGSFRWVCAAVGTDPEDFRRRIL